MKRKLSVVLLVLFAVLVAGCGAVSTGGTYVLESGETLRGDLWFTGGFARLGEGSRVTGSVFMTGGTLNVGADAEVGGDVFMTGGHISLGPRAVVHGNIVTTGGSVSRGQGARVEGKVTSNVFDAGSRVIGTLCVPPIVLLAVILYWLAGVGRRRAAAEAPADHTATLVIGGILVLVGVIFLIQNLTDWSLGRWNWWALFILIPAISSLINVGRIFRAQGRLTAAARGPLVGGLALSLAAVIFLFNLSWGALWPFFLIIIGVGVLITR